MANKKNTSADANVTRIKASDSSAPKTKKSSSEKVTKITAQAAPKEAPTAKAKTKTVPAEPITGEKKSRKAGILKPFKAFGGYFKGAWIELRQVRWPTRRATWGMTGAVLAYSAFFVVIVLLLDVGFQRLFDLMIG